MAVPDACMAHPVHCGGHLAGGSRRRKSQVHGMTLLDRKPPGRRSAPERKRIEASTKKKGRPEPPPEEPALRYSPYVTISVLPSLAGRMPLKNPVRPCEIRPSTPFTK